MRSLGNYRRENGQPPWRLAPSLLGWNSVRARLLSAAPWHVPVLYALVLVVAGAWVIRGQEPWQRTAGVLGLALAGAGISEFRVNCLFEVLSTDRRLILFHALTDALAIHAAIGLAGTASRGRASTVFGFTNRQIAPSR